MSINWVMLSGDKKSFTPLPGEQQLYTSPSRTALALKPVNGYPGHQPFSADCTAGTAYLTNRRIVYIPAAPTAAFESFSAPILNFHDTHVTAPFFGPNVWTAVVQPVPGGNIPAAVTAIELKMTFKDGGAYDFHSTYERIKERLQQAVDVARESGRLGANSSSTGLSAIDLQEVDLEELPAYEASSGNRLVTDENQTRQQQQPPPAPPPSAPGQRREDAVEERAAPPAYEDVQRESVSEELERRLRG